MILSISYGFFYCHVRAAICSFIAIPLHFSQRTQKLHSCCSRYTLDLVSFYPAIECLKSAYSHSLPHSHSNDLINQLSRKEEPFLYQLFMNLGTLHRHDTPESPVLKYGVMRSQDSGLGTPRPWFRRRSGCVTLPAR